MKIYHNNKNPIVLGKNQAKRTLSNLALELGAKKLTKKAKKKIREISKEFREQKNNLKDDIPQLT
jgi:phage terminase small subunit